MIRGFKEVPEEFKKVKGETQLPKRGSVCSAGYDFYSKETVTIKPGESHLFWTDVCSYMQKTEYLDINVRSSIGIKKDLRLKNVVGIIDADYFGNVQNHGNIGICLKNTGKQDQIIETGERIAQGIFKNYLISDNGNVDDIREGGIGSTNH